MVLVLGRRRSARDSHLVSDWPSRHLPLYIEEVCYNMKFLLGRYNVVRGQICLLSDISFPGSKRATGLVWASELST